MGKVKTGNPDSDKAQVIEKVTLEYLVQLLKYPYSQLQTYFTAAGVVPCGGRKTSPRTSIIVQFIFYFGPLRSAIIF